MTKIKKMITAWAGLAFCLLCNTVASSLDQATSQTESTTRSETSTTRYETRTYGFDSTIPGDTTYSEVSTTKGHRHHHNRRQKWSYSELKEVSNDQTRLYEAARRNCNEDQFYHIELQTCSKCIKYCPLKEDLSNCGIECRGYYNNQELQDENSRQKATNVALTTISAVLGGFLAFSFIALLVVGFVIFRFRKRLSAVERMLRRGPTADVNNGEAAESTASLLASGRQETGGE